MVQAHAVLAWLSAGAAAASLVAAIATAAGAGGGRLALDRAILVLVGAVLATSLVGLALPISGRPLTDPLHVLYGFVALAALPVARYSGRGGTRRTGRYAVLGAVVVLAVMLRLFMTGG
jgi:hypothetical protein